MTNPKFTQIVCLVDRTGSMSSIRAHVEESFGAFIAGQREAQRSVGDTVLVDLYTFDRVSGSVDAVEEIYVAAPIDAVPPLRILPRGGTPLQDALASVIVTTGSKLAAMAEDERPGSVIVVVATDGRENASVEYVGAEGAKRVLEMVQHQRDVYGWHFEFIGIGIDAWEQADRLGFARSAVQQADRDAVSVAAAYGASGQSVTSYRKSRNPTADVASDSTDSGDA